MATAAVLAMPIPSPSPAPADAELGAGAGQGKPKTFKRLRSSLEHSLRTGMGTVTGGKGADGGDATVRAREKEGDKEKHAGKEETQTQKAQARTSMGVTMSVLSRVSFRRPPREPSGPTPTPPPPTSLQSSASVARAEGAGPGAGESDKDKTARGLGERRGKEKATRRSSTSAAAAPASASSSVPSAAPSTGTSQQAQKREKEKEKQGTKAREGKSGSSALSGLSVAGAGAPRSRFASSQGQGNKAEGRYEAPSLRQASMSTPALSLSTMSAAQVFQQPYSPFVVPSQGSASAVDVREGGGNAGREGREKEKERERERKPGSISTSVISGPVPLGSRPRGASTSAVAMEGQRPRERERESPREREREREKHRPPPVSVAAANAKDSERHRTRTSLDDTVSTPRRHRLGPSPLPPSSPSPPASPRRNVANLPLATMSRRAAASTSHLPSTATGSGLSTSAPSVSAPLQQALARARSPSVRVVSSPASSSAHLPLTTSSSPPPPQGRASLDARRSSLEQQQQQQQQRIRGSPSPNSRAASPSLQGSGATQLRPRLSPTPRNYSPTTAHFRSLQQQQQQNSNNQSTTSLALAQGTPEQREVLRSASSAVIREVLRAPSSSSAGVGAMNAKDMEECERRLAALVRLERVWGRSGSQLGTMGGGSASGSGISAAGEERERRYFSEGLRDGFVLCQLVNKLFPNFIARIDKREDGFVRTSNVTKFLAASSSVGVPKDEIFHRDDLIEATPESLARVAKNILALLHVAEFPPENRGKVIQGQGPTQPKLPPLPGPYGSVRGASASTPNLSSAQRSASPSAPAPSGKGRKRFSPPLPSLPTVRSDSSNESDSEGSKTAKTFGTSNSDGDDEVGEDDVPEIVAPSPPPRSPLRSRPAIERASVADSTRASIGDSVRASLADSVSMSMVPRQSMSSQISDTTVMSSLFDVRRSRRNSDQTSRFGTLRTMTTEASSFIPSENPSLNAADAKEVVDEMVRRRSGDSTRPALRERRPSETAIVDLSRVVEEAEESSASAKAAKREKQAVDDSSPSGSSSSASPPVTIPDRSKVSQIRLGKGKWPDDFLDAFQSHKSPASSILDEEMSSSAIPSRATSPISISPPRKLSFVGVSRGTESVESLPQFPRRPAHRARHSVDTPPLALQRKDSLRPRDSSPDGSISPPRRIVPRRTSTRTSQNRHGIYIPRTDSDGSPVPGSPASEELSVPFPRRVSGGANGDFGTPPSQGVHFPPELDKVHSGSSQHSHDERPRLPRGRFQSDIDGMSARRKPRPQSYDDAGAKPRSRIESMMNMGAASAAEASASDLMYRAEGSAVRQTLIVKEEGKPPTQFQLGNCIGRGQFGAVYRALNLNTGQMVAVKRISLEGLKEEEIAQLMNEVDLVKSLSHPSIVKYEGMSRDDNTLNIVLEYAENGSLGQTLKAFGKLNERLVASYVVKILEGLHYLHGSDVVHCDLKAANILTTKNGNVKLSDFGVSLNLRAMEREMKDVAGTPNWMAPEVIELKGASPKSDIWSLGCTVIELLTGRPPYGDVGNSMSVMFRIVEDDMPPIPEGCSPLLMDFLKQCFNKEPLKRPSAEILCEHQWLKQNWGVNKDLRPQDSIPFLRRVSADLQKSEAIRYLAKIEMQEPERSTPDIAQSSPRKRLSSDIETISPREHSFVKTTFSKPVICRVCNLNVKRSAVLCEQCSLIAHSKCAANAAPTCDLRSQLLLYAQYAEFGSPPSSFVNPLEYFAAHAGSGPSTPYSDAGMSSRTSVETSAHSSQQSPSPPHPPTAFKGVMSALKSSRSFYNNHNHSNPEEHPASGTSSPPQRALSRKTSILKRFTSPPPPPKNRPSSIASSSSPPSSSLRSAATAAESFVSRPDTVRQSAISIVETDVSVGERTDRRLSRMTSYSGVSFVSVEEAPPTGLPGEMPRSSRDKKHDSKSDKGGCVVQ